MTPISRRDDQLKSGLWLIVGPWVLTAFTGWMAYELRDLKMTMQRFSDAMQQTQINASALTTKVESHENRINHLESKLEGHISEDLSYRRKP